MLRPSLAELERRASKLDHRRLGNWMARRVSRPLALRITWVVLPWGVSAHTVTWLAWAAALGAAAALGWGTPEGLLAGAGLLQLWYLLDHVDGQLARARGTASLDGVQLDYLMHHTVGLLVPIGLGWGCWSRTAEPLWLLAGLAWGVGCLVLGLADDTRYKAFVQRLKLVRGELRVIGGGGGRPSAASQPPRRLRRLVAWLARKALEPHVAMNALAVVAVVTWLVDDRAVALARVWVAGMAVLAPIAAAAVGRSVRGEAAEREFALWFQPPPGCDLVYRDGWWIVEQAPNRTTPQIAQVRQLRDTASS